MNIADIEYRFNPQRVEIYTTGCDAICSTECHNSALWKFDQGTDYLDTLTYIDKKIKNFISMIDWVWLMGGEPLLNPKEDVVNFLSFLRTYSLPIVLFTRFELDEIDDEIKDLCGYIKTGQYDPTQPEKVSYYGIELATKNQKVWKKENGQWN